MSLRSVDITKVKRLSLREVKIPSPKDTPSALYVEISYPLQKHLPEPEGFLSLEEILLSSAAQENEAIIDLISSLGLVLLSTGQPPRIRPVTPPQETPSTSQPEIRAEDILTEPRFYAEAEILVKLGDCLGGDEKAAKIEFMRLLDSGGISQDTTLGSYFIGNDIF